MYVRKCADNITTRSMCVHTYIRMYTHMERYVGTYVPCSPVQTPEWLRQFVSIQLPSPVLPALLQESLLPRTVSARAVPFPASTRPFCSHGSTSGPPHTGPAQSPATPSDNPAHHIMHTYVVSTTTVQGTGTHVRMYIHTTHKEAMNYIHHTH